MLDKGSEIQAVFFDLPKGIWLCSSQSSYGKTTTDWSKYQHSGLTCRKQMVVPQGSMGPLFSTILMIWHTIPTLDGSLSVLYADDFLLFHTIKGQEDFQFLPDDISSIDKWVQLYHLTLNFAKLMVMSRNSFWSFIYLGDTPLEQVECFIYLDVILASDLSFSQHIP